MNQLDPMLARIELCDFLVSRSRINCADDNNNDDDGDDDKTNENLRA